jgi:acyl-CoA reductase-like NAD-dependent aldehyde dehydrogenase
VVGQRIRPDRDGGNGYPGGGKSAHIVLDDADFSSALPMAAMMACVMSGQSCILPSRILLPRSRYEEGLAILEGAMENFAVGDPWTPGTCRSRRSARRNGKRCSG